jgi:hypothetical protein
MGVISTGNASMQVDAHEDAVSLLTQTPVECMHEAAIKKNRPSHLCAVSAVPARSN